MTKIPSLSDLKRCFKCAALLPRSEFYRHPKMGDGLLGKCKDCAKRDTRENYAKRHEYYRQYDKMRFQKDTARLEAIKKYRNTPAGRATAARARRRANAANPQRHAARTALGNAVRDGRVIRGKCERCGAAKVEAHHDDYSKPLDVVWLCPKHHRERHGKLR